MSTTHTFADLLPTVGVTITDETEPAAGTLALLILTHDHNTGAWSGVLHVSSTIASDELDHVAHTAYRIMRRVHRGGPPPVGWAPHRPDVTLSVAGVYPAFCRG